MVRIEAVLPWNRKTEQAICHCPAGVCQAEDIGGSAMVHGSKSFGDSMFGPAGEPGDLGQGLQNGRLGLTGQAESCSRSGPVPDDPGKLFGHWTDVDAMLGWHQGHAMIGSNHQACTRPQTGSGQAVQTVLQQAEALSASWVA